MFSAICIMFMPLAVYSIDIFTLEYLIISPAELISTNWDITGLQNHIGLSN